MEKYSSWSTQELLNRIQALEEENASLQEIVENSTNPQGRSSFHYDPQTSSSLLGRSSGVRKSDQFRSPLAARISSQLQNVGAARSSPGCGRSSTFSPPTSYTISMSVMVIDNGTAVAVPMTAILGKKYPRNEIREGDTPVVSSTFLRDTESLVTQRFSVGSSFIGSAEQREFSTSMELAEDCLLSDENAGQLYRCSDGSRRGSLMIRHSGMNIENNDDEPSPSIPEKHRASEKELMTRLNLEACGDLFDRNISLDSDAIISHQTLRLFNQQYRNQARALSPQSSYGIAIYHYIVQTFAVRNGCQHSDNDVEGFGRTLCSLCGEVLRILKDEPRHGQVSSPCYVFGDLHGNFRDLFYFMDNLISFQDLRYTPHRFLFLGDYVDRGEFSVEVVAYLFAIKVLAPQKVLLLRGNHEDTLVSGDISGYGNTSFRAQCHALFGSSLGEQVWHRASAAFAHLPLTANIDQKIFCVHGGIPRYQGGTDDRLELLKSPNFPALESFFQVPEDESAQHKVFRQLGMDSCWADPAESENKLDDWGFGSNPRGTGVILFGSKAVDDFLERYRFEYIFRAHQEKADGLKLSKNARVFTIFSTSAYVGHQNGAGVVLVSDGKIRLIIKNPDNQEDENEN